MIVNFNDYAKWYHDELNHTEKLRSRVSGHLTLLTALATIIVFLWTKVIETNCDTLFFIMICFLSLLFLVSCIYFACTYVGKKGSFVDIVSLTEDLSQIDEIEKNNPDYSDLCDTRRVELLKEYYLAPIRENRYLNVMKSAAQHQTILFIIFTYVAALGSTVYWLFRYSISF